MSSSILSKQTTHGNGINYGLLLLRVSACLNVVLLHFWTSDHILATPIYIFQGFLMTTFMVVSFYYSEKPLMNSKFDLKKRLKRIIIPMVVWAVIYYFFYWITGLIFDVQWVNGISDLLWQALAGHSPQLNPTMWFNFDLLVITLIFFLICKAKNPKIVIGILGVLAGISYVLQYTEIIYHLFGGLRYELSYPLGRIFEMLPCAVAGFMLSYYSIIPLIKRKSWMKWVVFITAPVLSAFFVIVPSCIEHTFSYGGFKYMLVGCLLVIFAALLPLDEISDRFKKIIKLLSKNTMGIYCCHRLVAQYINLAFKRVGIPVGTFAGCIIIYICSYLFIEMLSRLPVKGIKRICY